MKALRVPVASLAEGDIDLDVEASNYVLRVHRLKPNDALLLFDPEHALEADARLLGAQGRTARCRVASPRRSELLPRVRIALLQAYAKGDRVDRVVRDATALGATDIIIVVTRRTVVQSGEGDGAHRRERWHRIAVESARQCGRGDVPHIVGPLALEELPMADLPENRLVLAPDATAALGEWMRPRPPGDVALFIGPEGGLDASEIQLLAGASFAPVRFAQFVLRTETAATAVLGAIATWQLG
ncbi:MAG: RsmE family RNA methyltransferase [Polyangiaceae bacterium]